RTSGTGIANSDVTHHDEVFHQEPVADREISPLADRETAPLVSADGANVPAVHVERHRGAAGHARARHDVLDQRAANALAVMPGQDVQLVELHQVAPARPAPG